MTQLNDRSTRRQIALGRTGLQVSSIGYGAFKIGRNQQIKYPQPYDLPDQAAVEHLLNAVLDAGITLIDTAPAYGLSEERIGQAIGHRRQEFVLSTKVGETFENGRSHYDFSDQAVRESVQRSLRRLRTDVLDLVLIHAPAEDLRVLHETPVVETLLDLKTVGDVRAIGFSGKSVSAAQRALDWADVLMVEYHPQDTSHRAVIADAAALQVGVLVKKGLASGALNPEEAIRFSLETAGVTNLVVGGLNLDHIRTNLAIAAAITG